MVERARIAVAARALKRDARARRHVGRRRLGGRRRPCRRGGHEVTGIHLALSRNPQSYRTGARGCCTVEDANDARRAADGSGSRSTSGT